MPLTTYIKQVSDNRFQRYRAGPAVVTRFGLLSVSGAWGTFTLAHSANGDGYLITGAPFPAPTCHALHGLVYLALS